MKSVVDIIFDGRHSDNKIWFQEGRILQIVKGPQVKGQGYNVWSADGGKSNGRHFFVNKAYGGCNNDAGYIVVTDK